MSLSNRGDLPLVGATNRHVGLDPLDHEVLAAAAQVAAASPSPSEATILLDALGIHQRASRLTDGYRGPSGWLRRRIAALKPVGWLELRRK